MSAVETKIVTGRRQLEFHSLDEVLTDAEMLAVCGFDAATYVNADPTQQTRGRELLGAYGAAVLIPRNPLVFGHQYHVRIHTSQGAFEWNFATSRAIIETASSDRGIVPK